jgi:hypothetical protein
MTSQALGQRRLIFIAHAAEDRPLVSAIHSEIQTLFPGRFSIFNALDERSIEPSAEWRDRLRQAVTKTTLLLAVLTRNSVGKQWIYFESGGAYFQGIPVLPILGPGVNAVPDPFSSVQAVNICEVEGIRRLMNRLARLGGQDAITDRYRPERLLKKLDVLNAQSTALSGKSWAKFTEDAIRRYLQDATPGSQLSVRLVSYTGETTARTVPATISRYWRPDTDLKVSVLLKSEYDAFTIRPHAGDFNRYVRWRISRAKADWYGWMNNYKIQAHAKRPGSITLEIRDYNWEPAARALILGNREAFFGLYAMRFHTPSDRPSVDPAVDWVAARTQMVHFDSSSHLFVNDLCNWFEEAWQRSTKRTNEPYRCLVSADLWQACCKKQTQEREARREFMHWKAEARGRLETGNLGLPAEYPYERGRMIDFMASAVICGKGAGSDRSVLICEIREQGETWEGIGKSATYLDLIGIAPELRFLSATLHDFGSPRLLTSFSRAARE